MTLTTTTATTEMATRNLPSNVNKLTLLKNNYQQKMAAKEQARALALELGLELALGQGVGPDQRPGLELELGPDTITSKSTGCTVTGQCGS
eukprot:1159357-Pelagomonas_calceolata.AAC.10